MEGCAEKHFDDLLTESQTSNCETSSAKVINKYKGTAAAGAGVIFGAVTAFNMLFPDSAYEQVRPIIHTNESNYKKGVLESSKKYPCSTMVGQANWRGYAGDLHLK